MIIVCLFLNEKRQACLFPPKVHPHISRVLDRHLSASSPPGEGASLDSAGRTWDTRGLQGAGARTQKVASAPRGGRGLLQGHLAQHGLSLPPSRASGPEVLSKLPFVLGAGERWARYASSNYFLSLQKRNHSLQLPLAGALRGGLSACPPRIQEEASKNQRKHKWSNFLPASVSHSQRDSCANAGALYHVLAVTRAQGWGAELREA